jgi:hypothetical protein
LVNLGSEIQEVDVSGGAFSIRDDNKRVDLKIAGTMSINVR